MTITFDLEPEQEKQLQKRAARQGQDVIRFVQSLVHREASSEALIDNEQKGQSLAEFLRGYIGVVHGDGLLQARDSEEVFGEILDGKRRAGHL